MNVDAIHAALGLTFTAIWLLVGQILGPGAQISGALLGPGKTLNSQIKKKGEGEE